MKTPPVGLSVTGFAAAGLVVCALLAGRVTAAEGAALATNCNPSNGVGSAWQVKYSATINTSSLSSSVLKPGDELTTGDSGIVDFCIALSGTQCRLQSDTSLIVLGTAGVLFSIAEAKGVSCHSTFGKLTTVKVGKAKVVFRPPKTMRRLSGADADTPGQAFYSISFVDHDVHVLCRCGDVTHDLIGANGEKANIVRTLWGTGHGAFQTKGRYSSAKVRG